MLTAKVVIRGTKPLLWHHFGEGAIPLESRKEKTGVAGHDPEEWHTTYLVTEDGQLYLQPESVFGTLRDGAKRTKKRGRSVQKDVAATLQVVSERVLIDRFMPKDGDPPLNDVTAPVYIDVRSVKNPGTGARNWRYRVAATKGWKAEFEIAWDETIISRNEMQAIAIDAGRFEGLSDARAIGFGRFEVEKFTVGKAKVARRKKRA